MAKKWISKAIKHPGAHDSGTTGKRARLALTLRGMHHKK